MTATLLLPGYHIAYAHTIIAATAFLSALLAGWTSGLWPELCTNAVAGYPIEWFPSVSAVIGDHAVARAPFQILIAVCAGPRFLLLILQWVSHRRRRRNLPSESAAPLFPSKMKAVDVKFFRCGDVLPVDIELAVGLARTICCGGWMFVTSRDHHGFHDLCMIIYLLLNVPWMWLSTLNSSTSAVRRRRRNIFIGFMATLPPLIFMFYRHSVGKIPGAYTHYAFFEWALVVWDVFFDAQAAADLNFIEIAVIDGQVDSGALAFEPHKNHAEGWQKFPERLSGRGRAFLAWLSDLYLAICFWSIFTALSVQLFYWSVWKLALAGSELALLANFSAFFLGSWSTSRQGLLLNRLIMVATGMSAFALPLPMARLIAVSIATWFGWLGMIGNWTRLAGSKEMLIEGQVIVIAMASVLLMKYLNYSTNPLWCIVDPASGGWNPLGLALAVVALLEYSYRPHDLFGSPPLQSSGKKGDVDSQPIPTVSRIFISLGLGSLIHLVQTFLSDAGTTIAWTWTGFPVRGPTLHPFAAAVIALVCVGCMIRPLPPFLGHLGAFVLYQCRHWLGFAGGLILTLYLSNIFPLYIRAATRLPTASTFGFALAFNCVLDVLAVVTTAYAFVPYGWLFRERTDLILISTFTLVELGRYLIPKGDSRELRLQSRRRAIFFGNNNLYAGVILTLLAVSFSCRKMLSPRPVPYYPEHRMFSAGIWTVHFGIDEAGRDSQWRMMDLIRDMEVDVVGLLETDLHRFVYGNRDLTRVISEQLGYYVDLGPGPNKHTWGAALLSKFPILNSTHHLLPSPNGELAPAIHATLDIHGEMVNVMVSHNGQEEDALDRELQTTEIARLLRESEDIPTVFLGYLVTHPGEKRPSPYQILMEDGRMHDIEIEDRWRWCEYIAFRGLWRIAFARVHEGDISDTELQVGKFLLPLPGQKVEYNSNTEMYWHIGEDDIPKPWRMPKMFWGDGVRGHRYTTWVGPLYYLPPVHSSLQRYGEESK